MRIAWFIQELKRGGGHRVCLEVSKILAERGHDIYILVPEGRLLVEVPKPLQVIECGQPIKNPILSILLNGSAMLGNLPDVDIILSTMPYMGFLNMLASWFRTTRGIHFIMADDYHLFDDRTLIKSSLLLGLHKLSVLISYRLPLVMIANSTWTRNQVSRIGPTPSYILNPGVDTELFKPAEQELEPKRLYRLATIARKHVAKGWQELVEALNLLYEERQDFELTAITADPISKDSCRFPVQVLSPRSDVELVEYLQAADVFVFSSRLEGFGLPPLEAMACGVPVVCTRVGGIQDYAVHGENCWMVPVNSPTALKEGIDRVLNDPKLRHQLRSNGLKTAQSHTWQAFVDKLEGILDGTTVND
jgi:glycosyltransferase involved in cell wall biosynthesis